MGPARRRPGSDRRFRRPPALKAVGLLVGIEEAKLDVGPADRLRACSGSSCGNRPDRGDGPRRFPARKIVRALELELDVSELEAENA